MASPAEPVTDALYKALSSPNPDPQVVHAAIEEVRQIASQNVIAVLGAKIDAQSARIDAQITEIRAEMKTGFTEMQAEFTKVNARIDAQTSRIESIESRINDLRQVIWRVIWPLIGLLATTVFGLLYRVVIATPS